MKQSELVQLIESIVINEIGEGTSTPYKYDVIAKVEGGGASGQAASASASVPSLPLEVRGQAASRLAGRVRVSHSASWSGESGLISAPPCRLPPCAAFGGIVPTTLRHPAG